MLAPRTKATARQAAFLAQYRSVSKAGPHWALKHEKIVEKRKETGKHKNWSTRSQRALTHQEDSARKEYFTWSGVRRKLTKHPNINMQVFWSDILERYIEIPCTPTALAKIDEMDFSIDRYIMETPPVKMVSKLGEALRAEMHRALEKKEKEYWEDALTGDPQAVLAAMKQIRREEKKEWKDELNLQRDLERHDNVIPESFAQRWLRSQLEKRVSKILKERGWEPEIVCKQPEKPAFPPPRWIAQCPESFVPNDWDFENDCMKPEALERAYVKEIEQEQEWVWRQKKFKRNWITYPAIIKFKNPVKGC